MALTRKHFKAIADILHCHSPNGRSGRGVSAKAQQAAYDALVADFARYFRHENGRFDVDRFTRAANGDD